VRARGDRAVSLDIVALELPARHGAPREVLARVDALMGGGRGADLVLLPEACLTGYVSPAGDFDLTRFAEPIDGPSARGLADLARRHRAWLVGPLVLAEGEAVFNAACVFDPGGALVMIYRKRHPWIPETWATPGDGPIPVFDVRGHAVTIAICYDIHFLAAESAAELDRAEMLLFPSAWVEDGTDSRTRHFARLARRHRIAIAHANWGEGGDVTVWGQGGTRIVGADGEVVARATAGIARARVLR
jgi:predicted amidohydrolase